VIPVELTIAIAAGVAGCSHLLERALTPKPSEPSRFRSSADRPKLDANCRNCGAPPEPVCSYCGTQSGAFFHGTLVNLGDERDIAGLPLSRPPMRPDDCPSVGVRS
jgi:hypothetical protein